MSFNISYYYIFYYFPRLYFFTLLLFYSFICFYFFTFLLFYFFPYFIADNLAIISIIAA